MNSLRQINLFIHFYSDENNGVMPSHRNQNLNVDTHDPSLANWWGATVVSYAQNRSNLDYVNGSRREGINPLRHLGAGKRSAASNSTTCRELDGGGATRGKHRAGVPVRPWRHALHSGRPRSRRACSRR